MGLNSVEWWGFLRWTSSSMCCSYVTPSPAVPPPGALVSALILHRSQVSCASGAVLSSSRYVLHCGR